MEHSYLHLASVSYKHSEYGKVAVETDELLRSAFYLNRASGNRKISLIEPCSPIAHKFNSKRFQTDRAVRQLDFPAHENQMVFGRQYAELGNEIGNLLNVSAPTATLDTFLENGDFGKTPEDYRPILKLNDDQDKNRLFHFSGGDIFQALEFLYTRNNPHKMIDSLKNGGAHYFLESAAMYTLCSNAVLYSDLVGAVSPDGRGVNRSMLGSALPSLFEKAVKNALGSELYSEEFENALNPHSWAFKSKGEKTSFFDEFVRATLLPLYMENNDFAKHMFNLVNVNDVPVAVMQNPDFKFNNFIAIPHRYMHMQYGLESWRDIARASQRFYNLQYASARDGCPSGHYVFDLPDGVAIRMASADGQEQFAGVINPYNQIYHIIRPDGSVIETDQEWLQFEKFDLKNMRIKVD